MRYVYVYMGEMWMRCEMVVTKGVNSPSMGGNGS